MRRLLVIIFVVACSVASFAQQTQLYVSENASFVNARDLYLQGKYAASLRMFESVVAEMDDSEVLLKGEAAYYLAANAFELRRDDALRLLNAYTDAYPASPYAPEVGYMQGVLYVEQGDVSRALLALEQVKTRFLPAEWQEGHTFHLAYAYVEAERYEQAVGLLAILLKQETRYDLTARYLYAYSLYSLQKYDEAEPVFLAIEKVPAYSTIAPYYLVQIYHKKRDSQEVVARAERLLKANPTNANNSELYRILGEVYYERGQYAEAIDYLLKYEKMTPVVLRNDMYVLGLSFFQTGQYVEAIAYLSQVTGESDLCAENAYLHIGKSYVMLGDKDNARMAYQSATSTHFDASVHEEALYNYALTTYETSTAMGESVGAFTEFLRQYPSSKHAARAYELLTNVLMTSKNYRAAYDVIADVKLTSPQLVEAKEYLLYQLGTEAYTNDDMAEAVDLFGQSLALQGSGKYRAECLYWRAEAYFRLEQYLRSVGDLDLFFRDSRSRKSQNYVMAHYAAGYAHFSLRDYARAQEFFLKYTAAERNRSSATYADALNRVGDCYFNSRNFARADQYYAQAVSVGGERADYATFQRAYVSGLQKEYAKKINLLEAMLVSYPESELNDDALYEIARAHLMKHEDEQGIAAYRRLLAIHPNSDLVRKTALEIGMVYGNMKSYDQAVEAYQAVVDQYAGSEEAYMALEGMEGIYVRQNRVEDYMTYMRSLDVTVMRTDETREDSLIYIAAENQYLAGHYEKAIEGLNKYVQAYCPGGRYCVMSQYYLANAHYELDDRANALTAYDQLVGLSGTRFAVEAYTRSAEMLYDAKDYVGALGYFEALDSVAGAAKVTNVARLGMLRCNRELKRYEANVEVASTVIADPNSTSALVSEARYYRAMGFVALGRGMEALPDLQLLSVDQRTAQGAEAKYVLAQVYFDQADYDKAEGVIKDFASKTTSQQYWLARGFVLLADVYMVRGEDFQAKQYLLSVQGNYKGQDEVPTMISERLAEIAAREKEKVTN